MSSVWQRDTVEVEEDGGVATVWLSRPEQGNPISLGLLQDLSDALDYVEDEVAAPVLVLRSRGEAFCTGIDLRDFPSHKSPDVHGFNKWERQVVWRLERIKKVTIAAVEGACVGGGFHLVLACDLRVASRRAEFVLSEVKLGFLPGMATFRLAKYVGLGRAKNLMFTGRTLGATEAYTLGLLDEVVEPGDLAGAIGRVVEQISPVNLTPLLLSRRLLNESFEFSHELALGHMLAAQYRTITDDGFKALLEKEQAT